MDPAWLAQLQAAGNTLSTVLLPLVVAITVHEAAHGWMADLLGDGRYISAPDPLTGSEDFSYVLEKVPGAMFFLGVAHLGVDWRTCCSIHSG